MALSGAVALVSHRAGAHRWRMDRRKARRAAVFSAVAVLLAAGGSFAWVGDRAAEQFRSPVVAASADPAARLTSLHGTRSLVWDSALDAFVTHPWGGIGAGVFEFWWNREGRNPEFVRDGHSLYIETLAEQGIVGALILFAFLGSALATVVSSRRFARSASDAGAATAALGILAAFLFSAGIDWMWESTAVTVFALVAVGAAAASLPSRRLFWRAPVRAAASGIALLACLVQLPGLVSTSNLRESQAAARAGDLTRAIGLAQEAHNAQPWAASPYVQHGLLAESTGDLATARSDLRRAEELEPTNWRLPLLLARVQAETGQPRAALNSYVRARSLRPQSAFFEAVHP
jgi:hypothetical protein